MEKNSAENNTVHLLYKNLGETPNEAILKFKKDNPEYEGLPMTYAGRLDPMAEGLLLVLSGEKLQEKDKYLDLQKTYEAEILWGFETDTLDVLGLVVNSSSENSFSSYLSRSTHKVWARLLLALGSSASESLRSRYESMNFLSAYTPTDLEIKTALDKSVGKLEQKYPAYSSKPVLGKPLFQWAREGKLSEILIPSHEVEIFDAQFILRRTISGAELLDNIEEKILSVSGDFRQEEILSKWKETLNNNLQKEFFIDKISLTVSSGFYVRQFVADLAKSFGTQAITFHIKRIKIGDFDIANISI